MENFLDWLLSHENVSIAKTGVVSEKNNFIFIGRQKLIFKKNYHRIPNENTKLAQEGSNKNTF